MATDKCAQTICRSPEQIEYYGENWFIPSTIRKSLIWEVGPEPYGSILWPRYISENYRVGIPSYYYFRNSAFTNIEILLEGKLTFTQNGITEIIHPGEVYLMHEGADIHFSHGENDMFHKMRFSLRSGMGSMIINKLRLNKFRILRPASLEPLIDIHSELYQLFLAQLSHKIETFVHHLNVPPMPTITFHLYTTNNSNLWDCKRYTAGQIGGKNPTQTRTHTKYYAHFPPYTPLFYPYGFDSP